MFWAGMLLLRYRYPGLNEMRSRIHFLKVDNTQSFIAFIMYTRCQYKYNSYTKEFSTIFTEHFGSEILRKSFLIVITKHAVHDSKLIHKYEYLCKTHFNLFYNTYISYSEHLLYLLALIVFHCLL